MDRPACFCLTPPCGAPFLSLNKHRRRRLRVPRPARHARFWVALARLLQYLKPTSAGLRMSRTTRSTRPMASQVSASSPDLASSQSKS